MFDKEIKFISDFGLNKVKKLGAFFTFEQLKQTDIHPSILQYISAELDYKIYEDRKKLLQDSFFDYSGGAILNYFNQISEEIKKNKMLAFEDVKKLILHAVTFTSNYLARPTWALTKIIFEEENKKPVDEIKYILRYPFYYEHIRKVIAAYIDKKQLTELTRSDFESMLEKIDEQLLTSQTKQVLDNVLFSMADFFNVGELSRTKVPVTAIELYLKEKKLNELSLRLKRSLPLKPKTKYEVEELRKIIYSKAPIKEKEYLEPQEEENVEEDLFEIKEIDEDEIIPEPVTEEELIESEEEIIPEEIIDEQEPESESVEAELVNDDDESTPELSEAEIEDLFSFVDDIEIKEKDENEKPAEEENEELAEEEIIREENEDESRIDDESFEIETEEILTDEIITEDEEEKTVSHTLNDIIEIEEDEKEELINEKEEEKPIKEKITRAKDISDFMSEKESSRIIAGVFNEDSEDFVNTLERITECETYEQATEILKAVFASYKVNIYSKESVLFTNIVSNYFDQD